MDVDAQAQIMVTSLFGLLLILTLTWFVAISKLFVYMAKNQSRAYKEMGSPTLFMNNTVSNNVKVMSFILRSKDKELKDPVLSRKCKLLRWLYYGYSFLLLVPVTIVIIGAVSTAT